MTWLRAHFHTHKPIIAMCHLRALPGDPAYDQQRGLDCIVDAARKDLLALQAGGVDAIMFSNEASLPYLTQVPPITIACMARVIAELKPLIDRPFGVNVLWDPKASIDVAVATGASFVREVFSGVYASDFGLWNLNCGEIVRHQHAVGGAHIKLLYNIVPESAVYLAARNVVDIAVSTVFVAQPDALCVSGLTAGAEADSETLRLVKDVVPGTPVFANTGVRSDNLAATLAIADGTVTGTAFKRDGHIWNEVDVQRAREFMRIARACRGD
ncbi:MAG: BtpA/SgcQ family protein [Chloroflexi bacterium]|nr:BtpA/SgcQ family protein [Chloroflexota bacterium]MCY3582510.1 BtpA/SgcQ family protein [Chloroflexota bacterium]MCY3717412.1 BtpA/SgcQ family protein [Chloroflexota bacterium]MDE2650363.1 BtpA/SgcQ family protein [Chloroflexota bacterium]MXV93849.1 BtpA/SgcQ family protein [Chloroflexota bacterium]